MGVLETGDPANLKRMFECVKNKVQDPRQVNHNAQLAACSVFAAKCESCGVLVNHNAPEAASSVLGAKCES